MTAIDRAELGRQTVITVEGPLGQAQTTHSWWVQGKGSALLWYRKCASVPGAQMCLTTATVRSLGPTGYKAS